MAVPECSKLMTSTNCVRSLAFSYVIKDILIKSVTPMGDKQVKLPGAKSNEYVTYDSLCVSGGIVNALDAVKLAEEMAKKRRKN